MARQGIKVSEWEPKFVQALAVHAVVGRAAKDAGIARSTAYLRREKSSRFRAQWDEALEEALDSIELAVFTTARQGDMPTARWLLSRRRPQVYGDRVALEHTGPDGAPIFPTVEVIWHDAPGKPADA